MVNIIFYHYYCICQLAPSVPMLNVIENSTSIEVYWMSISDAKGYVIYIDDSVYTIIENTITVDELVPGTIYVITVRAHQDILGPASTIYAATNNG